MGDRPRLVPEDCGVLDWKPTLRTLVQGFPKVGKSQSCIVSAVEAFGFGYVINCGTKAGLQGARRETGEGKWSFNQAEYEEEIEDCIGNARAGAKSGKYKWILLDDFNYYVDRLVGDHITEDTQKDFNRWRALDNKVCNTIRRLFECDAHVIVTVHLLDWSGKGLEGQNKKDGIGFVSTLPGKMRVSVPGLCSEVIVMKFDEDGDRQFLVNPRGVYGAGCRSVGDVEWIDADLGKLQEEVERFGKKKSANKSAAPVRPAPATQRPASPAPKPMAQPPAPRKETQPNGTSASRNARTR